MLRNWKCLFGCNGDYREYRRQKRLNPSSRPKPYCKRCGSPIIIRGIVEKRCVDGFWMDPETLRQEEYEDLGFKTRVLYLNIESGGDKCVGYKSRHLAEQMGEVQDIEARAVKVIVRFVPETE